MAFVKQAVKMDEKSREKLMALMQDITNLENPNSVQQMKEWLADNGLETDSLGKKAVAEMLKTAPEPLGTVLELRQQLAKSSIKKYTAMENAVCNDGRARGMFQFYGANRTGRFSGRLIQLQNLPQNHMPDLEQARALVRSGNFDALTLLYDSIPEVLSELIRSAFSGEHATSRRPSSSNDNTINLFFLILSPPIRFDLVSSGFIILVMTMNLAFLLPALDFSSGL
jgi:DNA polymerase